MEGINRKWWKEISVYQVYPRSFKDSNGDGIGDINGLTSSLDYIKELGVDAIWLCPVYQSPNDDNGYDISNYLDIMAEFGTLGDWQKFADEAHKRGLKIVMDLVLNHTSNKHDWFLKASESKDSPYRDYYIWKSPKDGKEPNNWISFFGGSAWQYDDKTSEYYLHLFAPSQPDLNWENPAVRSEIQDLVKFWCDKGVDGFRMDVINVISKVPGLPDAQIVNEDDMYHWAGEHFFNGPRFMDYMQELKSNVLDKYNVFTVGETPSVTTDIGRLFTAESSGVLNMLFHFELMEVDVVPTKTKWEVAKWKLNDIKEVMSKWQLELDDGWNSLYLENHDQPRSSSRFGSDENEEVRNKSVKMLATFIYLLRGTPYIYQGQEIGMTNIKMNSISDYKDIESHNFYRHHVLEKKDKSPQEAIELIWKKGRDNSRTPMQWSNEENAGFTKNAKPWINVNPNYETINVEKENRDPNSILHYYRKLLRLRKECLIAIYGHYKLLLKDNPSVYVYTRTLGKEQLLVICNFFNEEYSISLEEEADNIIQGSRSVFISNYDVDESDIYSNKIKLRPYEARVYKIELE